MPDVPEDIVTRCCIVGGGPAGLMLGFLLARAEIDVTIVEKHADFLRDFRGDTIHPSTLEVMGELGLLDELLAIPHGEAHHIDVEIGPDHITMADFSKLNTRCKFIAFMPQWDLLNFIVSKARAYKGFHLLMSTEGRDLLTEQGRVVGLRARTAAGERIIRADLVVACDGRHSRIREAAGFTAQEIGAPMDVFWFKLSRRDSDPVDPVGKFDAGRIFIMINRGDHWQCGYVIRKGDAAQVLARGLDAFRADIVRLAPFMAGRESDLARLEDLSLLSVAVDRLPLWHKPGLLCIGDAAHAMSPVGGVGINLAIQDAIATANLLAGPLMQGAPTDADGAGVQRRREWPARVTQAFQVAVQKRVIGAVLGGASVPRAPFLLKLASRVPFLRGLPARFIGIGVRPEHVRTPDVGAQT